MNTKNNIESDIQNLVKASVIDTITAQSIQAYYNEQKNRENNSQRTSKGRYILTILFSVFGVLSVGGGIVLIVAHNWDILLHAVKISIAFALLGVAQILCVFVLIRKKHSLAWCEGSVCFLYFSLAAALAIISQIYQISGNMSQFLFMVLMLMVPVLYIFHNYTLSLLYVLTIIWLWEEVFFSSFFVNPKMIFIYMKYFIPLVVALPFYIRFQKHAMEGLKYDAHQVVPISKVPVIVIVQNWCISLAFLLGTFVTFEVFLVYVPIQLWYLIYALFFQVLYLFGNRVYPHTGVLTNAYRTIGICGMLFVIFYFIHSGALGRSFPKEDIWFLIIFLVISVFSYIFVPSRSMSYKHTVSMSSQDTHSFISTKIDIFEILCVVFICTEIIQESIYEIWGEFSSSLGVIIDHSSILLSNVLVLVSAVLILLQSIKDSSVFATRRFYFSIFIIGIWMVQRFLSIQFDYLTRGIVFIILGIVFLSMSIFYVKFKKKNKLYKQGGISVS